MQAGERTIDSLTSCRFNFFFQRRKRNGIVVQQYNGQRGRNPAHARVRSGLSRWTVPGGLGLLRKQEKKRR